MGPRYVSLNVCGERSDILTWPLGLGRPITGATGGGYFEGSCCRAEVWANVAANCKGHCECAQEHAGNTGARCGCLTLSRLWAAFV